MLPDRKMYTIGEAAHLLRVRPATLRWWLEGRDKYPSVIRVESTGSSDVTWGEFVEARFLREYRKYRSLQMLRPVIETLRRDFGVDHPLAHLKPFVGPGRQMTLAAQRSANLAPDLEIVHEIVSGQLVLGFEARDFLRLAEFHPDGHRWARRIWPEGRDSPVVIDPEYSFGAPTIRGVKTEALSELVRAGEPVDAVAGDYSLTANDVMAAVSYEWRAAA